MTNLPVVLIPGINCSARVYSAQIPHLWRYGPVTIANHTRGETVQDIASQIVASAPARFALIGFSFGGYLAFEILRQAGCRVGRLALIDTSARADTPEQSDRRRERVEMALEGRFVESLTLQFPLAVHPSRRGDEELLRAYLRMADECGAETFVRHSRATISRPDSLGDLNGIRCPTMILVGDSDLLTPPTLAQEMASGISGAKLEVIQDAGHLTPLERPDAVTRALIELLDP